MKPLSALLPLCAFCGCASLSSYQEARVLEKGQGRIGISYTGYADDLKKTILAVEWNFSQNIRNMVMEAMSGVRGEKMR